MKIRHIILTVLLALAAPSQAQTITALPAASALSGTELLEVVQSGSKKATAAQIKTLVIGAGSVSVASSKTLTVSNTLTLTATDGSTLAIGGGGTLGALSYVTPGANVATALGVAVGSDGAFVTRGGNAGTPSALVCTNCTGTASGLTAGTVTTNANLTGDVTSSGNATTLATVNGNVGSFTNSSITVNGKGLITAASSGAAGAVLTANIFTRLQTITQSTANEGIVASTGGSNTGSNATSAIDIAWTANTTGNPALFKIALTNTASGATTKFLSFLAGASGTTEVFNVDKAGKVTTASGITSTGILDLTPTSGSYTVRVGTNGFYPTTTNTVDLGFVSGGFSWKSLQLVGRIGFDNAGTIDASINRGGVATIHLGEADVASAPVSQTLRVQSASGVSNTAGADWKLQASAGTGSAAGGAFIVQVAPAAGSASTKNAYVDALKISTTALTLSTVVAPASSGTRYLCIDTGGIVTSSASACSGT